MTEGDTSAEALTNLQDAMRAWVRAQLEDRDPIPLHSADGQYSGKFVVRVPPPYIAIWPIKPSVRASVLTH